MSEKQKTIKTAFSVEGTGLHTGNKGTLTFKPAPENHGYKFRRTDLNPDVLVPANVDHVIDTSRGTSIEYQGVRIDTVEHVLAALAGLEIDNVLMELNQSETPILDGSSRFYIEQLQKAGIVEQNAPRNYFELTSSVTYSNPETKVEITAIPSDEFRVSVMIDYDSQILTPQNAVLDHIRQFKDEIASCRTFVFLHELDYLLKNNLIKGGDLNNAIVFVDRLISQEELDRLAKIFNKPKVEVLKEGILNNLELRFPNEPARHKLLDVVGDLALIGVPIKAHVIANRPGHFSNVQFAKMIKKMIKKELSTEKIPVFDPNKPPVYDIMQIQKMLPHRPPFLFIDRIIEMSDTHVVGMKNVTMNEPFLSAISPENRSCQGYCRLKQWLKPVEYLS
jgi:UDP-3-O-[3-hydroxymyristoyl] N-acetylglucosamine deacetylase/3-hydroxyacyl-[acyl-carrier-protein] dehydratase